MTRRHFLTGALVAVVAPEALAVMPRRRYERNGSRRRSSDRATQDAPERVVRCPDTPEESKRVLEAGIR